MEKETLAVRWVEHKEESPPERRHNRSHSDPTADAAIGPLGEREAGNAMHPMLPLFDALAHEAAATLSLDAGAGRVLMIELDPAPLQEPA